MFEEIVPTIVVDNFFETPSLVYANAQQQEYFTCTEHPNRGYWPGKRSRLINDTDPIFHEIICSKIIKYIPAFTHLHIARLRPAVWFSTNLRNPHHLAPASELALRA